MVWEQEIESKKKVDDGQKTCTIVRSDMQQDKKRQCNGIESICREASESSGNSMQHQEEDEFPTKYNEGVLKVHVGEMSQTVNLASYSDSFTQSLINGKNRCLHVSK